LIGLSATALWELWQRVIELDNAAGQQRAEESGRKRQAGGGRKKAANVLCRLLVTLIDLLMRALNGEHSLQYAISME
jgi:hypothetical protein